MWDEELLITFPPEEDALDGAEFMVFEAGSNPNSGGHTPDKTMPRKSEVLLRGGLDIPRAKANMYDCSRIGVDLG